MSPSGCPAVGPRRRCWALGWLREHRCRHSITLLFTAPSRIWGFTPVLWRCARTQTSHFSEHRTSFLLLTQVAACRGRHQAQRHRGSQGTFRGRFQRGLEDSLQQNRDISDQLRAPPREEKSPLRAWWAAEAAAMHVETMLWALAPGLKEQPRCWSHLLPEATQRQCRGAAGCRGAAAGSPN